MDMLKMASEMCGRGLADTGSCSQTLPERSDRLSELLNSPPLSCGYDRGHVRMENTATVGQCKAPGAEIVMKYTDEEKVRVQPQQSEKVHMSNLLSIGRKHTTNGLSYLNANKSELNNALVETSYPFSNQQENADRKPFIQETNYGRRACVSIAQKDDTKDSCAAYSKLPDDIGNSEADHPLQTDVPIQHNVVSSTRSDEMDEVHRTPIATSSECDQFMETSIPVDGDTCVKSTSFKRSLRQRKRRITLPSRSRHRRETLQDMARPLKRWLCAHKHHPYPSKQDKYDLSLESAMTLTQVSNWFANARRRLKNTVGDEGLNWETRILQYNDHVVGKAELLSISSEDSDLDSEEENMEFKDKLASETIGQGICHTQSPLLPETSAHETMLQRFLREPLEQYNLEEDVCSQRHDINLNMPLHDRSCMDNSPQHQTDNVLTKSSSLLHGENQEDDGPTSRDTSSHTHTFQCRGADLHWKEVSAALVLSSLAHSVH